MFQVPPGLALRAPELGRTDVVLALWTWSPEDAASRGGNDKDV